jgi:hypothetical protein
MGYRSEVAFVISFETKEKLDNYLAPRLLDGNLRHYRDNFSRLDHDEASVMFHHMEIKWYDNYHDVQALIQLYQGAEEAGGAYNFVRIGEDDADIETEFGHTDSVVEAYTDDFYPVRYLNLPSTYALTFGEEQ